MTKYHAAKTRLRDKIESIRQKPWKNLVEKQLCSNPWGTVYKRSDVACWIENGFSTSPQESLQVLLDQKFPEGMEDMDTLAHLEIWQLTKKVEGSMEEDIEFTEDGVLQVLKQIIAKTVPDWKWNFSLTINLYV